MTNNTWTEVDEARFKEMEARRNIVQAARRERLESVLRGSGFNSIGAAETANFLIPVAGPLRDALEPYDTNGRPKPDPIPDPPTSDPIPDPPTPRPVIPPPTWPKKPTLPTGFRKGQEDDDL